MTDQFLKRDFNKRIRLNALLEKGWAERELTIKKEKENSISAVINKTNSPKQEKLTEALEKMEIRAIRASVKN